MLLERVSGRCKQRACWIIFEQLPLNLVDPHFHAYRRGPALVRLEIRGKAALSSEREGKEASSSVPGVPASQKGVATTSQSLDRAACPGLWVPREGARPSDTPGLLGLTAEALSLMLKHTPSPPCLHPGHVSRSPTAQAGNGSASYIQKGV